MTVISIVEGVECDEREYAWLGLMGGTVVLFSDSHCGTIVATTDEESVDWMIGTHRDDWDIDMFEPFTGRVTLANEDVEIIDLGDDEEVVGD